jgi:molybdopterin biosynthesis enzyme
VTITGAQGSGILRSMVKANGLVVISEDREIVRAGEKVRVQLIDSSGFGVMDSEFIMLKI